MTTEIYRPRLIEEISKTVIMMITTLETPLEDALALAGKKLSQEERDTLLATLRSRKDVSQAVAVMDLESFEIAAKDAATFEKLIAKITATEEKLKIAQTAWQSAMDKLQSALVEYESTLPVTLQAGVTDGKLTVTVRAVSVKTVKRAGARSLGAGENINDVSDARGRSGGFPYVESRGTIATPAEYKAANVKWNLTRDSVGTWVFSVDGFGIQTRHAKIGNSASTTVTEGYVKFVREVVAAQVPLRTDGSSVVKYPDATSSSPQYLEYNAINAPKNILGAYDPECGYAVSVPETMPDNSDEETIPRIK